MRKLVIPALFILLGSLSTVQAQSIDSHTVETTLTEIRNLSLHGLNPSLAVRKSASGNWTEDLNSEIRIHHDLAVLQHVTVHTLNGVLPGWQDRYLLVNAVGPLTVANGLGPAAQVTVPINLVVGNEPLAVDRFPLNNALLAVPLITNIAETNDGGTPPTPGPAPNITLRYQARAGTTAITNITDSLTVVYTLEDQP